MPELTVDFNGTAHVLSVDDTELVDAVRHRLSALTDIPRSSLRLCCAGEVLQNGDERICSLRSTTLTAWTQRYSRHRSDSAFAAAEAQRRQEALRREELARPLWQAPVVQTDQRQRQRRRPPLCRPLAALAGIPPQTPRLSPVRHRTSDRC